MDERRPGHPRRGRGGRPPLLPRRDRLDAREPTAPAITRSDGSLLVDEEVAHNRGRVLYEPSEAQLCGEDSPKRRS
jgi:hypothetical protein